uniref:Maturase K n=1 Tax=Panagrolaimus superbus TaxID=310955 RepID=A0A914XYA5_9BILA
MDVFRDATFNWDRMEQRYGITQGFVQPRQFNFHLAIVEMYYKYFHGIRIAAHIPYRMRKRLMRVFMISFVKKCFFITYQRYSSEVLKSEIELLLRFELYQQFLPNLKPFDSYFC